MKKLTLVFSIAIAIIFSSCADQQTKKDIELYTHTWDEIFNNRNLEYYNEDNFDKNITLIMEPENVVGIEAVKEYYNNFLDGFSDIEFTMKKVFGQNNNLVKHWNFKGTHTGDFFGIPATGNKVDLDGTTIIKMKNGKIAQEQDFFDNMAFMSQLGLVSDPNNLAVIQELYNNFGKGDVPAVLAVLDANVVWNEAEGNAWADGNPYKGPEAVLNGVFARVGAEYDYFKTVDLQLHEMSNNQILATLRYQAKLKKNGAMLDAQAAHFWTLKDGKVIAFQQYVDTKQLNDASNK
ncbi:ester cyclase [Lutibacter profundi]|nr:ester cyclase [Lutibacter profundi]